jgi:hypothetical protein
MIDEIGLYFRFTTYHHRWISVILNNRLLKRWILIESNWFKLFLLINWASKTYSFFFEFDGLFVFKGNRIILSRSWTCINFLHQIINILWKTFTFRKLVYTTSNVNLQSWFSLCLRKIINRWIMSFCSNIKSRFILH